MNFSITRKLASLSPGWLSNWTAATRIRGWGALAARFFMGEPHDDRPPSGDQNFRARIATPGSWFLLAIAGDQHLRACVAGFPSYSRRRSTQTIITNIRTVISDWGSGTDFSSHSRDRAGRFLSTVAGRCARWAGRACSEALSWLTTLCLIFFAYEPSMDLFSRRRF